MTTEAYAQSLVRLEAASLKWQLWRNNVGQLLDDNGRPVRYGLANDSSALNAQLKSSDLFGWRSLVVTPDMVGTIIAQPVSPEVKRAGWRYTGTPREVAQLAWIDLVRRAGGIGGFATGERPLAETITGIVGQT